MSKKLTQSDFIARVRDVHGNKYDYSKAVYKGKDKKGCIVCPVHGEFLQRPDIHLSGSMCPKCVNEGKTNTLEYYIELSEGRVVRCV